MKGTLVNLDRNHWPLSHLRLQEALAVPTDHHSSWSVLLHPPRYHLRAQMASIRRASPYTLVGRRRAVYSCPPPLCTAQTKRDRIPSCVSGSIVRQLSHRIKLYRVGNVCSVDDRSKCRDNVII